MTAVQDFLVIAAQEHLIGTPAVADDDAQDFTFRLFDVAPKQHAILQFEVQGLTGTDENPVVEINTRKIGEIDSYIMQSSGPDDSGQFWMQQTLIVPGHHLRNDANRLEITTPRWTHSDTGPQDRHFQVRNIVLFYRTDNTARTVEVG